MKKAVKGNFSKQVAAVSLVASLLGGLLPGQADAGILLFVNYNRQNSKIPANDSGAFFNAMGGFVFATAGLIEGGKVIAEMYNDALPKDSEAAKLLQDMDKETRRRRKARQILILAAATGMIILDEEPQHVEGSRSSSFSMETLEMTYPREEAQRIYNDLVLLDKGNDKGLIKFPFKPEMIQQMNKECDARCRQALPQSEAEFLKEATQKLSERASEISRQSYQISELTSRHLIEIVTGYSFESESTEK